MHVLAFRHAPLEGIGSIADALDRHGIECRVVSQFGLVDDEPWGRRSFSSRLPTLEKRQTTQNDGLPHQTDADEVSSGHSGLILMGGPMSANDDLPWIPVELNAIRDAVRRGIPVLGICLGSQLIARALGARVFRNSEKEIGWGTVEWTEAARTDPLFRGFSGSARVFQWHGETFDLPESAAHLAYSADCRHQAFRVGSNVYGIQFHLEVTPGMIAEWLRQDEACGDLREATAPIDPHAHALSLSAMAATVFDRWCGLLH